MTKLDGHTDVETDFEAEFLASLDYELNLGANARATWLTGYIQDDSVDVDGDFCIRVLTTQNLTLSVTSTDILIPCGTLKHLQFLLKVGA